MNHLSTMKKFFQDRRKTRGLKNYTQKERQWSNEALRQVFDALNSGYKMKDISNNYEIPKSTLREHYFDKRKFRKIGSKYVFTIVEEWQVV